MGRQITTISKDERTYVPVDWKEDEEKDQLVFTFKPMSKRGLAKVSDSSSKLDLGSNALFLGSAEASIKVFQEAVCGIKGLIIDEKEVKFKKAGNGLLDDKIVEDIPLDIIEETAKHILEVSKFGDADKESL